MTAPYKISYTKGPDGKVSMSIDIHGPLPDPLAGLSSRERALLSHRAFSWEELRMVWSGWGFPAPARQVIWVEILARRRQAHDSRMRDGVDAAPVPTTDKMPKTGKIEAPIPYNDIVLDPEPEQGM